MKRLAKYQSKLTEIRKEVLDKTKDLDYRMEAKRRMMYAIKRFEYSMGSMMVFFIKDIKVEHLEKFSGRYFRFALIMKLVLFEIMIVSLQMLPRFQLGIMTMIQLVVIVIIFKALFIDRIYNHKFFGFMDLLTEVTIFCYLIMGNLNTYMGEEKIGKGTWTKL